MDQLLTAENQQLKELLRFVVEMSGLLLKYQQQLEEVRAKCKCDGVEWREPLGEQLKQLHEKAEEIKLKQMIDKVLKRGKEETTRLEMEEELIEDEVNENGDEEADENVDETTDGVAKRVKRLRRSTRRFKRRRVVDDGDDEEDISEDVDEAEGGDDVDNDLDEMLDSAAKRGYYQRMINADEEEDEEERDRNDENDSDYDVDQDDERNFKVDDKRQTRVKISKINEKKCLEMGIDLSKFVRSPSGLVLGLNRPKKIPGQNIWLCDYPGCNYYTSRRDFLIKHVPRHTKMKIKCDDCDKMFVNLKGLESHKKWEHSTVLTGNNKCSFPGCDYVTRTWYELEGHEAKHTGKEFRCDLCARMCAHSVALKQHKKSSHQKNLLTCDYPGCGKQFDEKYMKIHRNTHVMPHACSWPGCDYRSANKRYLDNHISTIHSKERPFVCSVEGCSHKFATADKLKTHIKFVHSTNRPFKCSWPGCGMSYKTRKKLIQHERTHSGDKPFACDWPGCEFRATAKDQVTYHRRIVHERERNLACPWPGCEKRFYNKVHLDAHHNTHTGERPFKCQDPDCQMTFISQNYMHKHFKKKHQT